MANSPTARQPKERDIQRAILDYLAAERILCFRMNSGAMFGSHKGKRWKVGFGTPGMADILAFPLKADALWNEYGGEDFTYTVPLWIEVKAPKGKQSPEQASFQQTVEANGHKYLLARSVEDVQRTVSEQEIKTEDFGLPWEGRKNG